MSAWCDDISVLFDVDRAAHDDGNPFHAHFDLYHFGHSVLAYLDSSTARYLRNSRKSARDGIDSILLQLFLEGGVQFGVGNQTTYAEANDIVVFDLTQPIDNINQKFRHITAVWPRTRIEEVVPDIHRWHGHTLPRDNPSVRLLRQHMMTSYELAPRFSPQEGLRVEAAAIDLVGAATANRDGLPEGGPSGSALKEMLIYQIKRHIRRNLDSIEQNPDQIAAHFGISRRRLYKLMEPMGGIAHYQTRLRLQRCLSDLQDPNNAGLNISEVAYRWGFGNLATFNRNFKNTFGLKPSDARSQFVTGVPPASSRNERCSTAIRAEHQQWFIALDI